jgi:hypothetical protein
MFSMRMKTSILMRMLKLKRYKKCDIAGEGRSSHAIIRATQDYHQGRMKDVINSLSAQFLELRLE